MGSGTQRFLCDVIDLPIDSLLLIAKIYVPHDLDPFTSHLWLFAYELIISEKNCVIMEGLFLFLMLKYFYFFRSYYFQLFSCDKLSNLSEFVRYCAMTRFTVAKPISGASEVICAGESIEVNLVPCPLKILI